MDKFPEPKTNGNGNLRSFTAAELVSALVEINKPDATVVTEIDFNGDILVGHNVRRVSYDGFHHRITISGILDPKELRRILDKSQQG